MAEHADIAAAFQARLNSDAETRQRGKSEPEIQPGFEAFNGLNCVDCGDAIHPVRLAAGRVRCTECQDFLERGVR